MLTHLRLNNDHMQDELQNLNPKELRALLRQETRKFLLLLEQEGTIDELEILRAKMRAIGDILTEKERTPTDNLGKMS